MSVRPPTRCNPDILIDLGMHDLLLIEKMLRIVRRSVEKKDKNQASLEDGRDSTSTRWEHTRQHNVYTLFLWRWRNTASERKGLGKAAWPPKERSNRKQRRLDLVIQCVFDGLSISHSLGGEDFSPTKQVSNPTLLSIFFHFLLIYGTFKLRTKRDIMEAKWRNKEKRTREIIWV